MRIPAFLAKREPLFRRLVIILAIVILIGCAVRAAIKIEGDFKLHRESGRRFVAGEFLYTGGHDFPYPPFFAMVYAPAAILPMRLAQLVYYSGGLAVLLMLMWILQRLVRSAFSLTANQAFWATAIAAFLCLQFVIHDQAIAGLNTALIALAWLAIYFWKQGRDLPAALSLGAAIAIKCTPAIFLGYFLWKRQWRMAIYTTVAALLFTASPMIRQGPVFWSRHMKDWINTAIQGVSGSGFQTHEDFRDKNMALRPVLMRYLVRMPEPSDHLPSDPATLDFFDFSPGLARWIVFGVLLTLVTIFMWWSCDAVLTRDDPRLLWELSAIGILMLLLSPITWGQHCVALLPAAYMIAALVIVRDRLPVWIIILLSLYILFSVLAGRDLIGRHLSLLLVNYHVTTFCIVGLLPIVIAGPRLQELAPKQIVNRSR